MKKALSIGLIFVMVLSFASCAIESKELTETAVYEDFTLVLGESEITDGRITIHATYTNASQDPYYAFSCFAVRAFQNDKALKDVSDVNGDQAALIKEIKNGQSLEVTYVFELEDTSPVEVLVGEPTADMTTIGKRLYD